MVAEGLLSTGVRKVLLAWLELQGVTADSPKDKAGKGEGKKGKARIGPSCPQGRGWGAFGHTVLESKCQPPGSMCPEVPGEDA